jgi:lysozyme family protein
MQTADVASMIPAERDDIYRSGYWNLVKADTLAPGLDLAVFDAAVNSGPGMATKWLQTALGIKSDGDFGETTTKTVAAATADNESASALIEKFCALRQGSLERLATWPTFGKGWSARIASVQEIALAWNKAGQGVTIAGGGVGPAPAAVATIQGNAKANVTPQTVAKEIVSPVAAQSVTVGVSVIAAAAQGVQTLAPMSDVIPYVKWALLALVAVCVLFGLYVTIQRHANVGAALANRLAKVNPQATTGIPEMAVPDQTGFATKIVAKSNP